MYSGSGAATNVRLSSNAGKDEVVLGTIPLTLSPHLPDDKLAHPESAPKPSQKTAPKPTEDQEPAEPHLRIGPVLVAMNNSSPVNGGGWISTAGYRFFLRGDMELKDLFRLEDVLGLPVSRPAAEAQRSIFGANSDRTLLLETMSATKQ